MGHRAERGNDYLCACCKQTVQSVQTLCKPAATESLLQCVPLDKGSSADKTEQMYGETANMNANLQAEGFAWWW